MAQRSPAHEAPPAPAALASAIAPQQPDGQSLKRLRPLDSFEQMQDRQPENWSYENKSPVLWLYLFSSVLK